MNQHHRQSFQNNKRRKPKINPSLDKTLHQVLLEAVQNSDATKVHMALRLGAIATKEHLLSSVERANKDILNLKIGTEESQDFAMSKHVVINSFDVIRQLLASGTLPYSLDVKQTCLAASLNVAVEQQHQAMVEFFLENERNKWIFEPRVRDGKSPLHLVGNNVRIAKILLTHSSLKPTDIDASDCDGLTPFHIACRDGHFQVATVFLKNGAYPHVCDKNEWTALHHAISRGHIGIAKWLIKEFGPNSYQQLPIFHAVGLDNVIDLKVMTQLGIDPWHKDSNGDTALLILEKKTRGHGNSSVWVSFLQDLVGAYPNIVNAPNCHGVTALHVFATRCEVFLPVFQSPRANLGVLDCFGRTPLMKAVIASSVVHVEILAALMTKSGIDLNVGDQDGWTAVHWACFLSLRVDGINVVKTLLKCGASLKCTNLNNRTPLHLVGYKRIGNLRDLTRYGDHTIDHLLRYPVKTADCEGGYLDVVNALVDGGASSLSKDKHGNLPFFTASAGHLVDEAFVILVKAAEEGLFDQLLRQRCSPGLSTSRRSPLDGSLKRVDNQN